MLFEQIDGLLELLALERAWALPGRVGRELAALGQSSCDPSFGLLLDRLDAGDPTQEISGHVLR